MTEDELRAIKERAEKATPGPWVFTSDKYGYCHVNTTQNILYERITGYGGSYGQSFICCLNDQEYFEYEQREEQDANADFIARARQDIPALIAEVERLRAALKDVANFPTSGIWNHAAIDIDDYSEIMAQIAADALNLERTDND